MKTKEENNLGAKTDQMQLNGTSEEGDISTACTVKKNIKLEIFHSYSNFEKLGKQIWTT